MTRAGFTLVELLTVLALTLILTVAAALFTNSRRAAAVDQDINTVIQAVQDTTSETRRRNVTTTLTVNGKTLTRISTGTRTRTYTLRSPATLTCNGTCPAGGVLTFSAPYGRTDTDFQVKITGRSVTRSVTFRGPLALAARQ